MPEGSITLDPAGNLLKRDGAKLVDTLATGALLGDETRVAKDAEVLRDRWATLRELVGQSVDRGRAGAQAIEERAARWIGDGAEDVLVGKGAGQWGALWLRIGGREPWVSEDERVKRGVSA